MKCHKGLSNPSENIPILAATRGTLSITAEPAPNLTLPQVVPWHHQTEDVNHE